MKVHLQVLSRNFPHDEIRSVQHQAFRFISEHEDGTLLEMPTGSGKTSVGITVLRTNRREGPCFYVTPTKQQVEQVVALYPDHAVRMYGRSEYPCIYYENRDVSGVTAQESPCYMLRCGHRVDQTTGQTAEEGAAPCPYFQAKFDAKRQLESGGIVICTTAFFLMNRVMVRGWSDLTPAAVVLDEVHRLAKVTRGIFEYRITDFHLKRVADALRPFDETQAGIIRRFYNRFYRICRRHPSQTPALLRETEIVELLEILQELDAARIESLVRQAVDNGNLDPLRDREELKLLENLVKNIPRYILSFRYAAGMESNRPLNFVVAFYYEQDDPEFQGTERRVRYYLTIKSYYVAGLIRKAVSQNIVAYSATIGQPGILEFETGLHLPFQSFPSSFDSRKTRIFLPKDVPNLSQRTRGRGDLNRTLRLIVRTAKRFAEQGKRSLVVVISDAERQKFLEFAGEDQLNVISYHSNGMTARRAAELFKDGTGDVLIGTTAQYSEGIDLPAGTAPVIFFLRPGYPRPDDPEAQFEQRRFGQSQCWALWNWRVMIEALQVRGRNIRSAEDIGVCFFMSTQFRNFVPAALPRWLEPALRGQFTMDEAVRDATNLLK